MTVKSLPQANGGLLRRASDLGKEFDMKIWLNDDRV